MIRFRKIVAMGFLVGVLAVAVTAVTLAQQRGGRGPMQDQGQMQNGDQQQMDQRRQQWMERRQQMLAEIQAMEQRLTSMVDALNAAPDQQAQMDALILLVNELADQHIQMFQKIQQMHEEGMRYGGMHGKRRGGGGKPCPMMDGNSTGENGAGQDGATP
ncbi:MAG: hypothetical protein GX591_13450 [Planctomycetes bacterium]|nr:hypothetical protein [Planctomycetota bacterium]